MCIIENCNHWFEEYVKWIVAKYKAKYKQEGAGHLTDEWPWFKLEFQPPVIKFAFAIQERIMVQEVMIDIHLLSFFKFFINILKASLPNTRIANF